MVEQGALSLGKTADKSFVQTARRRDIFAHALPSIPLSLLKDLRVFDPLPAGVTSPPTSIGQGGTFGPYVPLPAVPGNDAGPPVLDTAMTVSDNFRNQGQSVTVTLNVKSSNAVPSVTPDLTVPRAETTDAVPRLRPRRMCRQGEPESTSSGPARRLTTDEYIFHRICQRRS